MMFAPEDRSPEEAKSEAQPLLTSVELALATAHARQVTRRMLSERPHIGAL